MSHIFRLAFPDGFNLASWGRSKLLSVVTSLLLGITTVSLKKNFPFFQFGKILGYEPRIRDMNPRHGRKHSISSDAQEALLVLSDPEKSIPV